MKRSPAILRPLLLCALAAGAAADENDWFVPLGQPPRASPRRIAGGEGVPPLPLPATPLRRSEQKREPSPFPLFGKVVWGETAMFTYADGSAAKVADWNLCPGDVQQLMAKAGRWFGLTYGTQPIALSEFHWDPVLLPVLFFSGGRTIRMDPRIVERMRGYVMRGGMLVFDSIAGSPYFYESALRLSAAVLPDQGVRKIPRDHPVYHILQDVDRVTFPKNRAATAPELEGVYVGCRIGALVSRFGLGCGWDDHDVPLIEKAVYYDVESANRIGLNLVAYAVGYANVGREEAKPELYGALDEKRPTDEFVFAQLRHEGAWNVHPGAAASLLRRLRQSTSLRVNLKRVPVTAGRDDLSSFPFLYLTGLDEFSLDDKAASALREFLSNSGTLLINNGLGLSTFDRAVRRELRRVLPQANLEPVPPDHPVFAAVFRVAEAAYTPAVTKQFPDLRGPTLEGISIGGDLRVIYSPYDMEGAWLGVEHPLARGYEPKSGMELGVNVAMYAMTH